MQGPSEPPLPRRPRTLAVLQTSGWEEAAPEARAAFETAVARLAGAGIALADGARERVHVPAQLGNHLCRAAFAIIPIPIAIAAAPPASQTRFFAAFRPTRRSDLYVRASMFCSFPLTGGVSSSLVTAQTVNGVIMRMMRW